MSLQSLRLAMQNVKMQNSEINKTAFHALGRKVLRKLAMKLEPSGEYSVRSCLGGPGVEGEVILHTPRLYLMLTADGMGPHPVMIRTCQGMKDYTGGPNQWAGVNILEDPEGVLALIGL